MAELTKEQIACEEKFLEGIPRWNIGALFLPCLLYTSDAADE